MKLYDKIKSLLQSNPELRNSDKLLMWKVWDVEKLVDFDGWITEKSFMKATSPESITRARRKVQELHPELQATKQVKEERDLKSQQKGTFIFRETLF